MERAELVARRVIDAVNAHDLRALRTLYVADARTRRPGWLQEGDAEDLLASYELDFACVPDIMFSAPVIDERRLEDCDRVAHHGHQHRAYGPRGLRESAPRSRRWGSASDGSADRPPGGARA